MEKLAFSVMEAAERMNMSRAHLYNEWSRGRISFRKSGNRTVILAEEIERYLNALPEALPGQSAGEGDTENQETAFRRD